MLVMHVHNQCNSVLVWSKKDERYMLDEQKSWTCLSNIEFAQGSKLYSFATGEGLIGLVDTRSHSDIHTISITHNLNSSLYHRKALALAADIAIIRAIKWHNIIVEFTASSRMRVTDDLMMDYCKGMVFAL